MIATTTSPIISPYLFLAFSPPLLLLCLLSPLPSLKSFSGQTVYTEAECKQYKTPFQALTALIGALPNGMIFEVLSKLFGSSNDRQVRAYAKQAEAINTLETIFEAMSDDDELRAQTGVLRKRLENGETESDILNEAFATVREAAKRTLGQRHYDVQLIGGLVLNDGKITEMKTGEGKTLVSATVYLNAISGKGVHVVTVNDYLAQRDAEWMGQVYGFLGLTTGCIVSGMMDEERRAAYACDITYGTNNEFGFDYLRDNMKYSRADMVQRPFHYAIIDEVDSILIDEARTPLIISGPSNVNTDLYPKVDTLIPSLKDDDYEMDEKNKTIVLTEDGQEHVEKLLRDHNLLTEGTMYDLANIALVHHANKALKAHKLFRG